MRHWSDAPLTCICGKSFRSHEKEAHHRHNFPALCRKPPKWALPTETQKRFMAEMDAGTLKPVSPNSYMYFEGYKAATRIRCFRKRWIEYDDTLGRLVVTAAGRAACDGKIF